MYFHYSAINKHIITKCCCSKLIIANRQRLLSSLKIRRERKQESIARENGVLLMTTIQNRKSKNSNYQARYDVSRATCSAWFRDAICDGSRRKLRNVPGVPTCNTIYLVNIIFIEGKKKRVECRQALHTRQRTWAELMGESKFTVE